jgi:hypothetical protein
VPGVVRPTVGAFPDEARNAWEPDRDYVMVSDKPLNQVRRAQSKQAAAPSGAFRHPDGVATCVLGALPAARWR